MADEKSEITAETLAEAEKLARLRFTDEERARVLELIPRTLASYDARRRFSLANDLAPATVFDPRLPTFEPDGSPEHFERSPDGAAALPSDPADVAFAPLTHQSRWIECGDLSSVRLTELYLERLRTLGPRLNCVVTLCEERAIRLAERADVELAAGRYRGPLHGIPWGAKDLLDTAGIATTWGAPPFRGRIPAADAEVVRRLDDAGAVLVAKLSTGELAMDDVWFGGQTKNPWNTEQGSSGSSAGPASATAAGLVGFAIGSETLGSIVSPCARCGATGLRPTFGRVPRTGAMMLCPTLDKLGPIARSVEDTVLVLRAISGSDGADPSSIDAPLRFDAGRPLAGLRVGFAKAAFESGQTSDSDRAALEALRRVGLEPREVELPDLPYDALLLILQVESAATFEELTLTDQDDRLHRQDPFSWPHFFRTARFVPAVEYAQAERFRRHVMHVFDDALAGLDAILAPVHAQPFGLVTNNTGHPAVVLPAGFRPDGTPQAVTLLGRLFDEGTLCRIALALEAELGVRELRPPGF